jgi:hypothetical protein
MTGRQRSSARGPFAFPWRTALFVGALGLVVMGVERPARLASPVAATGTGYDPGALRLVLGGVPTDEVTEEQSVEAPDELAEAVQGSSGNAVASTMTVPPKEPVRAVEAGSTEAAPAAALLIPASFQAE